MGDHDETVFSGHDRALAHNSCDNVHEADEKMEPDKSLTWDVGGGHKGHHYLQSCWQLISAGREEKSVFFMVVAPEMLSTIQ